MNITELISKIEAHTQHKAAKTGTGYSCRCPAHEDGKASLCLSEGQGGRVLVKCQAGCGTKDVVAALGLTMKDLFSQANGKATARNGSGTARIVASYDYNDESGKLLFQVCRLDPKDFRQRRPDKTALDGWTWKTSGVRRVLYRLPELLAAVKSGQPVFIAEGEKDVDALAKQGLIATCNCGGAGKWRTEYNGPFRGAAVFIVADKDAPGRAHAVAVADAVKPLARCVKVLDLPDVNGKPVKDAADFFAAGGTADELRKLADTAPEYPAAGATPQETPLPAFHYDKAKGDYWRKTPHGDFVRVSETDLKRHLRFGGIRVGEYVGSFGLTKFDDALCRVQNESAVDHAFSLAGHKAGLFHTEDGRRVLIPRTPKLIAPRAGPFPNFEKLLGELFGAEQLPYLLGWWKVALEDLHGLEPARWRHNQMLALVGKPDCGKSFLQMLISSSFGGREADPYPWMVGKTDFNEDLAEAEHWKMEDKNAHRDAKSRANFGGAIKQATVSQALAVHGKGKKQVLLFTFRRMTSSINDDPDYITVLPMLDSSVAEKIIILQCARAEMLPDWKENRARFMAELPAFVHFLLKVHSIAPELQHGRYGVKTYHAPEIVDLLSQFEPHLRLLEIIDAVLFKPDVPHTAWRGTATELQKELTNSSYEVTARQLLCYSTACGQLLSKIAASDNARVKRTRAKGVTTWTLHPPT
ncbi:MAG: hypothetical protein MUF81_03955 [Verrucomicrobia bacterium]|jgi:hypothetical protein|nr:hypothetical protein [Verrucomicrobiota bacterium]